MKTLDKKNLTEAREWKTKKTRWIKIIYTIANHGRSNIYLQFSSTSKMKKNRQI